MLPQLPQLAKPWLFPALKASSNDTKITPKNHAYHFIPQNPYSAFAGTYHQPPAVLRHVSANSRLFSIVRPMRIL